MKKVITVLLVLTMAFSLFGCSGNKQTSFDIKIVIPAGSHDEFAFSDEEISPVGNKITITPLEGISDVEFCLEATEGNDITTIYPPMTITTGTSFERKVEDKAWYRLGIKMNNDTEADKIVYIRVEPVEVRIEDGISNSLPQDTDVEPMVMVDGKIYVSTGKESTITARCGIMDGKITSYVDGNTIPTQDNQSNFGDGYGYQYGTDGTIEVCMDGKWYVYEVIDNPVIASSVSKIGKGTLSQTVDISADDAASLTEIIKSGDWIRDNSKCEHDCVMTLSGYSVHYHSECGTLEKIYLSEVSTYSSKEHSTNSMLILDEQTKDKVNAILKKYIDLENE